MKKIQIVGVRETPTNPKSGKGKWSKTEEINRCMRHISVSERYKPINYRKITSSRTIFQ